MSKKMNFTVLCLSFSALLIMLFGCPPPAQPQLAYGNLKLQFDKTDFNQSRTIEPHIDMEIAAYDISGVAPGGLTFTLTDITGTSAEVSRLAASTWTVSVSAKNSTGAAIGLGVVTVDVAAGTKTTCSVSISPIAGTGALAITLDWEPGVIASPQVNATLKPADSSAFPISFTLNADGHSASYSNPSLAAGYYLLNATVGDGNEILGGFTEAVRIVTGQSTVATVTLIVGSNQSLEISVINNMSNPVIIGFSGQSPLVDLGSEMTVTATTSIPVDSYQWILNGIALEGQTDSSITIGNGLAARKHRLDLLVTKGAIYSTNHIEFELVASTVSLLQPKNRLVVNYDAFSNQMQWYAREVEFGYYHPRKTINYFSGDDMILFNADDEITGCWDDRETWGVYLFGDGMDGIWFTADDDTNGYETFGSASFPYSIKYDFGGDNTPFTGDETIQSYYHDEYSGPVGNVEKRVVYDNPGADGQWMTSDDLVTGQIQYFGGVYYTVEYPSDIPIFLWGGWTRQKVYDGPGADGIWFTADDHVILVRTHEFGDGSLYFTRENTYDDAGADGIWFTGDDVLVSYQLVTNTF